MTTELTPNLIIHTPNVNNNPSAFKNTLEHFTQIWQSALGTQNAVATKAMLPPSTNMITPQPIYEEQTFHLCWSDSSDIEQYVLPLTPKDSPFREVSWSSRYTFAFKKSVCAELASYLWLATKRNPDLDAIFQPLLAELVPEDSPRASECSSTQEACSSTPPNLAPHELFFGTGHFVTNLSLPEQAQITLALGLIDHSDSPINDTGLQKLVQDHPHLKRLNLNNCQNITDAGLKHLEGLACLEHLELCGCPGITDEGLKYLEGLPHLKHLISDRLQNHSGWPVDDTDLQKLVQDHPNLTSLKLNNCRYITDEGLEHIKELARLEHLELCGCERITNEGLKHLTGLEHLRHLELNHCKRITDPGLLHLTGLKSLKHLEVLGCHITGPGLTAAKLGRVWYA